MSRYSSLPASACCAAVLLFVSAAAGAATLQDAIGYYRSSSFPQAYSAFRPLAENGAAEAQFYVGLMHLSGMGTQRNDAEAVAWLRKSAGGGFARAALTMSDLYAKGVGVERNLDEAARWNALAQRLADDEEELATDCD